MFVCVITQFVDTSHEPGCQFHCLPGNEEVHEKSTEPRRASELPIFDLGWRERRNGCPLSNAPIDTIKTRIQRSSSTEPGWRRFMEVITEIVRKEGWPAFYKGLTPRLLRVAPGQAVTFMVYEKVKGWIEVLGTRWREEAEEDAAVSA
ncbi:mitochondrial carrier protein-domain-containing protein [Jimgerdemannia flammicorona]|uniref:Mitochondrial carrier protein-domain-containing protein n=1 Tax=Jimgerdemannia flammicorona TaxID=994334 RepID=A0A433DCD7_9FUNG|nr:mitochondrial carrier protein-domain-containing protein [Jimgerdemannia flammicorona]